MKTEHNFFNEDFTHATEMIHNFFIYKARNLFLEIEKEPNSNTDFILTNIHTTLRCLENIINISNSKDILKFKEEDKKKIKIIKDKLETYVKTYIKD